MAKKESTGFSLVSGRTGGAFSPLLVKHLTYVVGVLVTFNFGATTVSEHIQVTRQRAEGTRTTTQE